MTQNDVDVDAIRTLFAKWCNAKTLDTGSNAMTMDAFAIAVTEALAGRWAKDEDLKKFGMEMYGSGCIHGKGFETVDEQEEYFNRMISQFKPERGIK
jgi:hypothetical protein